jgi:hypothetical protein
LIAILTRAGEEERVKTWLTGSYPRRMDGERRGREGKGKERGV